MESVASPAPSRLTILLLGTGHWGNPTVNYINPQYDDMLGVERQREIQECLERLQCFQPTKVAVEVSHEQTDELDEQYRQYRAGTLSLTASEIHQLGFRLADLCNHDLIYAIDWHDKQQDIGWESVLEFARAHEQTELISWSEPHKLREAEACDAQSIAASSVREMLLEANDADGLRRNHQIYADLMRVGEDEQYIGADVIGRWYERNMKMYVNLSRMATSPDDRVLVIVGAGHVPLPSCQHTSCKVQVSESIQRYLGG